MSLRPLIKKILPRKVTHSIGNLLVHRRERLLGQLSIREAFDEVYRRGMWKQGSASSGLGSEGWMADGYIELVLDYASKHKLRTVADAGCGDFSVGSRLARHFERYTAFDVSPLIIKRNEQRYADLAQNNVTFAVADMTSTVFPRADLILIRQVLQHLTNSQIERILQNLEASEWRRVLITEDVHDPRGNKLPNIDLPSHTVRTRVSLGSGVFVDKEPFSRQATRIAIIDRGAVSEGVQAGLLVFELTRNLESDRK
jgi:Methyltransferase domain